MHSLQNLETIAVLLLLDIVIYIYLIVVFCIRMPYFKRFLIVLWIRKYTIGITSQMGRIYDQLKKRYE